MSKLDKAINQIITHPNYNRLVECFSAHRWGTLTSPAKIRVLQTLENEVAKMTNRRPKKVKSDKFALSILEVGKDEINLKTRDLENDTSPYIFLREYLLEFKLQEQNAILKNNNRDKNASEEEFTLWKKNNRVSLIDSELKCLLPKSDPDYHYQPLLVSANSFATETVEKMIKTVYQKYTLDKYIERFYAFKKPFLRVYGDVKKQAKVLEQINEKAKIIESERKEITKFIIRNSVGLEKLSDKELYASMHPILNRIHDRKLSEKLVEILIKRELATYGITSNIKINNTFKLSLANVINNITNNIIINIDKVNARLSDEFKKEIRINKGKPSLTDLDKGVEPNRILRKAVYLDIKKKVIESITSVSDNPKLIEEINALDDSFNLPFERVIEEYYGVSFEEYYNKLIKSLSEEDKPYVDIKPRRDFNLEIGLRKKIINHVKQIHSFHWNDLSDENKKQFFQKLEDIVSNYYGVIPTEIVFSKDITTKGVYNHNQRKIYINDKDETNQYKMLEIYFHEKRHNLQFMATKGEINPRDIGMDHKQVELLRRNEKFNYYFGISNYIFEPIYDYVAQPQEIDAFRWSTNLNYEITKDITELVGEDIKVIDYLSKKAKTCPYTRKSKAEHEQSFERVLRTWDENEKIIDTCDDKFYDLKSYFGDLEILSNKEFYNYFNEYVWYRLSDYERVKVIKELDRRECLVNKRRRVDMNIIEDYDIGNLDAARALEAYYNEAFIMEVSNIMVNEDKYNEEFIRDIKEFCYSKNEISNPFLSKLESGSLYFYKYINRKMNKIKPYALKHIGKEGETYDSRTWDHIISKYDGEALIEDSNYLFNVEHQLFTNDTLGDKNNTR